MSLQLPGFASSDRDRGAVDVTARLDASRWSRCIFSRFFTTNLKTKNILGFSSNFGQNRRTQDKWHRFLRHLSILHVWRCDYVIMALSLVYSYMTLESKSWAVWNVATLRSFYHEILLFIQRVWVGDGKTWKAKRFRRKNALRLQRLQRLRFS